MKRKMLRATALCIDVGAPLIATATQFPLWVERSAGATVSGLFVFFLILSAIPLFKCFKHLLKSPSAPIIWGLMFGLLSALHVIIEEMLVISFVGLVANLVGWVLFKIAGEEKKKEEE
jgi:hypothetical protein